MDGNLKFHMSGIDSDSFTFWATILLSIILDPYGEEGKMIMQEEHLAFEFQIVVLDEFILHVVGGNPNALDILKKQQPQEEVKENICHSMSQLIAQRHEYEMRLLFEGKMPKYKEHISKRNYNYFKTLIVSILQVTTTPQSRISSTNRFWFNLQSHTQHLHVRWDQTIQNYEKIKSKAQTP